MVELTESEIEQRLDDFAKEILVMLDKRLEQYSIAFEHLQTLAVILEDIAQRLNEDSISKQKKHTSKRKEPPIRGYS